MKCECKSRDASITESQLQRLPHKEHILQERRKEKKIYSKNKNILIIKILNEDFVSFLSSRRYAANIVRRLLACIALNML